MTPENLRYSNSALLTAGTDGLPLGDLNWYPDKKALWVTKVKESGEGGFLPKDYALSQNYPNPFNPITRIYYRLSKQEHVKIAIFNLRGQHVRTLVGGVMPAGLHSVDWDGTDETATKVSSGVYIYTMEAGSFKASKTMIYLK